MKQRARPLNRLLSLFLALVMALSLLPTAVLADDEISSGTDTGAGWDGSGTVTTGWGGYDRHKWFARLTLVYFPGGLEKWKQTAEEGGGYTIYGQLDTSSDYDEAKMREVKLWYNTNAMEYLAQSIHYGPDNWADLLPSSEVWGQYTDGQSDNGFIPWSSISKSGKSLPALLSGYVDGENVLLDFFTDPVTKNGETTLEANEDFEAVLNAVVKTTGKEELTIEQFKRGEAWNGETGGDWRLFVETGVLANIGGDLAAVTLRDMAAWDKNYASGNASFAYNWYRSAQWPAYGLCLTRDEFVDLEGTQVGPVAYAKVPSSEREASEKTKSMRDFRDAGPGSGYGIGIINPGDMGGATYESYVGRVNLYIPTNGQTVANPRDDIQVGSEVYTYVGQRAGLYGDLVEYNWKNPYDPSSSRGKSVDENSAQAQSEYEAARSPKNSVAAGLYGSMEGTIRNELFNSSLSAKNFDSAMSAVNTDGIIDHNVVKAAPALKDGLEWGYIGEAVFNLNMYRSTGQGPKESSMLGNRESGLSVWA